MSRYFSYINSSKKILDGYDGSQPFHLYLKKQFSANKNFGSRDRKTISAICYAWLRTSHLFSRSLQDNNLLQAIFLCSREDNPVLEALAPELNARITSTEIEKLQQLQFNPSQIFPFEKQLGAIDPAAFSTSFLIQPLLFIRTRPGKKDKVAARL
ncbi:MAG: Fmu (Sun) domain-containing protein, partial [Chitinophagaceae bacterium]